MTTSDRSFPRLTRSDIYLSPAQSYESQTCLGFIARKKNTPWPLSLPLDWDADPYRDRNWRSKLQHWRMTDPILEEYFASGDRSLLNEAFSFVADWHRYHVEEGRTSSECWNDAVTGIRLIRLAFFLDRLHSGELVLTAEHEAVLRQLIALHVDKLMEEGFIATSNHGLFQVLGLKLASVVLEDERHAADISKYADRKFEEIFLAQYDEDGVHREHSPSYHFFAERVISPIAHHFGAARVKRILPKVEQVKKWLVFPDGLTVRVGDSSGARKELDPPDGPLQTLDDARAFLVGDLTKSGYAIVRSPEPNGPSMLFVTATANSLTHKHADELSFELYEHGRPVLIDSGKYGYFSDSTRKYFKSAAAHNTVALNDERIAPSRTATVTTALGPISSDGAHFRIAGYVERADLFRHERTLLYCPGRYLVVLDGVRSSGRRLFGLISGEKRDFVSSLHFAPDLEIETHDASLVASFPDARRLFVDELTGARLETVRGRKKPMLGWHSESYGQITATTTARAFKKASTVNFAWVVCVDERYRGAALDAGGKALSRMGRWARA